MELLASAIAAVLMALLAMFQARHARRVKKLEDKINHTPPPRIL
jgi:hypothetical protein